MVVETVAGRIRVEGGQLHCESPRTFGSAFMMLGMVLVAIGIVVHAATAPLGMGLLGFVGGIAWMAAVWYWAGGRFGSFVVDPARGELRGADGALLAKLDEVRFFTVFDATDGTNFWTGKTRWLTASCPGPTRTYRLGKMSAESADRVLAQLKAWGCNVE